jgi:ribosome-associated protein
LNDINVPDLFLHVIILAAMERLKIPFSEFTFAYSRSSGAGGQHVNKVNSKVELLWNLDESPSVSDGVKKRFRDKFSQFITASGIVHLVSQKTRSQKGNIDDCIDKLHDMLNQVLLAPKIRKPTRPKRSAVLSRLQSKKKDSEKKRMRKKDF